MNKVLILLIWLLLPATASAAEPANLDEQVHALSSELRCVVCQNLSVADSPSEMAQQMRAIVREQLQQGKSPEEIKAYFVSKYGEWVLLSPSKSGFSLLLWLLPFAAAGAGIVLVGVMVRRWTKNKTKLQVEAQNPALLARVRRELTTEKPVAADPQDPSLQSPLAQERDRLYAELRELDFDYQAGKFSESDYSQQRRELEDKAAAVLKQLDAADARQRPAKPAAKMATDRSQRKTSYRGWQIAVGGVFLLLFGLALGIFLTQSLRPRGSAEDSITGDFLTGTGPTGIGAGTAGDLPGLLQRGRAAFARQQWAQAIEAFKAVLAVDPSQPEAHSYMGLILVQAGHGEGALMAFDKALARDPNFPLALWGKGMVLYRDKQDYAGARESLEKLRGLLPAGEERAEVEKLLAEIPGAGKKAQANSTTTPAPSAAAGRIQGRITIDPKIKGNWDGQAALFIIARAGQSGGGPPLAVKKIDKPVFPLAYTIGAENVMMQGTTFSGKVIISARLDKDGNPMTQEPGNLTGAYKKNPVEIGSKDVDIVLDRVSR